MKFIKALLAIAIIGATAAHSFAQGFGSDSFSGERTIILSQGALAIGASSNGLPAVADLTGIIGVAKIDVFSGCDNASGTQTVTVQNSADNTNWTTLSSCVLATNIAISRTNFYYSSTGIAITDTNFLTGVVTTPTASSAGFATTYIPAAAFTNTATWVANGPGWREVGFVAQDANRYLRVVVVPGGTGTNQTYGAVITGTFAR
jgi:hypothetical protein